MRAFLFDTYTKRVHDIMRTLKYMIMISAGEQAIVAVLQSEQEAREGKILRGDLKTLLLSIGSHDVYK